ncbi:unnamed protein product, partial [Arabidopsis halleri]
VFSRIRCLCFSSCGRWIVVGVNWLNGVSPSLCGLRLVSASSAEGMVLFAFCQVPSASLSVVARWWSSCCCCCWLLFMLRMGVKWDASVKLFGE